MITTFIEYLKEAKLGSLATIIGNNKEFTDILSREFDDAELVPNVYLEKYNKNIIVNWNHTTNHNIKKKIKDRSQIMNMSEFNDIFVKVITELFDNFDLLEEDIEKYDIFLTESNIHIITIIRYDQLFNKRANIFVLTVLPQFSDNAEKIINFPY